MKIYRKKTNESTKAAWQPVNKTNNKTQIAWAIIFYWHQFKLIKIKTLFFINLFFNLLLLICFIEIKIKENSI